MNSIYYIFIIFIFLITSPVRAEDFIKVLMLDSPAAHLPSEKAITIQDIEGKVIMNEHVYEGTLSILKDKNTMFVVSHLPFEEYIEGVVASEINKNWDIEALKAQAVIARTYATFYKNLNKNRNYHLTSSVLHQLYNGANVDSLISYATRITRGEILLYQNTPIKAFYHAACEGSTELPEEVWGEKYPYVNSVECKDRNTPYKNWQRIFSLDEIEKALAIDTITNIRISSYTKTGRVKSLLIISGQKDDSTFKEIEASTFRRLIGYNELPSTQFTLIQGAGEIIFEGKGFGHGVGLSQWGALEMARQGKNYKQILSHYYPGTMLGSLDSLLSARYYNSLSQN